MAYEMIRFSFADPLLSRLKELATEGESVHLTAKRLLSDFLGGDSDSLPPSSSDLTEIFNRLEALEENQGHLAPEDLARLEKLEMSVFGLHSNTHL